jgi:hypothetical protein
LKPHSNSRSIDYFVGFAGAPSLAVLQHCLRFAFAYSIDLEMESGLPGCHAPNPLPRPRHAMQVLFPNAFGHPLPQEDEVLDLQDQYGFSQDCAEFLFRQNGFSFDRLADSSDADECLAAGEDDADGHSDLRHLFGLGAEAPFDDLQAQLEEFMFRELLFPIGAGYNGNVYVEVLAGKYQGFIASLDHEMFAGSASLEEFLDEFELDAQAMDRDELADALCDPKLGLAWFHARSLRQFLSECVFCDEALTGFALDADDLPDELMD